MDVRDFTVLVLSDLSIRSSDGKNTLVVTLYSQVERGSSLFIKLFLIYCILSIPLTTLYVPYIIAEVSVIIRFYSFLFIF